MFFEGNFSEIEFQIACEHFHAIPFQHVNAGAALLSSKFEEAWDDAADEDSRARLAFQFAKTLFATITKINSQTSITNVEILRGAALQMFTRLDMVAHEYAADMNLAELMGKQAQLLSEKAELQQNEQARHILQTTAGDVQKMVSILSGIDPLRAETQPQPAEQPRATLLGKKPRRFNLN
jgi:hypothetical protein